MKQGILERGLFLLFCLLCVACAVDIDDEETLLGVWIETAPVPERTMLIFAPNDRFTRIDGEGEKEVYIYRIEDETLFLSLASELEGSSEIFLEQIGENKLKVGNLYPSFPEMELTYMIFERK